MRIVVHRDIPDSPQLQLQWNALVQQMESPQVFYTREWALAMRKAYSESLKPLLLLAYETENEKEVLIGVAALATYGDEQVSFLCGTSADYCDFVSHPDRRLQLVQAALAELSRAGLSKLSLTSIPSGSATIPALRSLARTHGYHLFVRPTAQCAQVKLGSEDERFELKSALAKKKIFRYSMNSLRKEGPVCFTHLAAWEEVEPALEEFYAGHVARFLAMGRISNIVSAPRRVFLSELAHLLSNAGWLTLSQLLVGDHTVAWNYGFRFSGSWFWYQPTFDTSYERLSPGYCLLSGIISEACDQEKIQVVDLGLGAEGYKERFGNRVESTQHVTLTKSIGSHATEMVRYSLARAVKSIPRAESAVRSIFEFVGRFQPGLMKQTQSGALKRGPKATSQLFHRRREIVFYQWMTDPSKQKCEQSSYSLSLSPITLEMLAIAAMTYENEPDTLSYLIGSARRLQSRNQGFALLQQSIPVSFCWIGEFEGFQIKELKTQLGAPSQNAVMIFECWTPHSKDASSRHLETALSLVAQYVAASGKEPWIFTTTSNQSAIAQIQAAGFARRYSFFYKKTMARQHVSEVAFDGAPEADSQASS